MLDTYECICKNPVRIPSNLSDRVWSCGKCHGKIGVVGAIEYAKGTIFALQTTIDIKKKVDNEDTE